MNWHEIAGLSRHLTRYLGQTSLTHALVLGVFGLSLAVLRRRSAGERYLVGICCLAAMAVGSAWPLAFERLAVPVLPPVAAVEPVWRPEPPNPGGTDGAASASIEPTTRHAENPLPAPQLPLATVRVADVDLPPAPAKESLSAPGLSRRDALHVAMAGAYLFVAATLLAHLILALTLVAVRLGRAEPARDRAVVRLFTDLAERVCPNTNVRVMLSRNTSAPVTLGWLRHWVLLPEAAAAELSRDDLSRVLMHELAHVQRNDFAANLLQQVFKRVFWFDPLVWLFDRQLRLEREKVCDDAVLSAMPDARAYAQCLTDLLSQQRVRALNVVVTAGVLGFASNLHSRISSILEGRRDMSIKVSRLRKTGISLAAIVLGMGLGGLSLGRREAGPSVALGQEQAAPAAAQSRVTALVREFCKTKWTREDVKEVFGEPDRYSVRGKVLDERNLPSGYSMAYYGLRTWFMVMDEKVHEVRVWSPDFVLDTDLRTGLGVEEAIAVLGEEVKKEVHGQELAEEPNVLYRDTGGKPGLCYLYLPKRSALVCFTDSRIGGINLLSAESVARRARRAKRTPLLREKAAALAAGHPPEPVLNTLVRELEKTEQRREDVERIFGPPDRYSPRRAASAKDTQIRNYSMWYFSSDASRKLPDFLVTMRSGRVYEIRIWSPQFELVGGLHVGSEIQKAIELFGEGLKQVSGRELGRGPREPNLLYRDYLYRGKKREPGSAALYWPAKRALVYFKENKVYGIFLQSKEAMAERDRQAQQSGALRQETTAEDEESPKLTLRAWSLDDCVGTTLKRRDHLAQLKIKVRAGTAAMDELQTAQLRLIHAVETSYWRYALAAERKRLARELAKSAREVVRVTKGRVRAGVAPEMDLLDCMARAARLELARVEATGEAEKLGTRLFALATGKRPADTERVAPTTKPILQPDLPGTDKWTAKAERQRPDLLRAAATVKTGRIPSATYAALRAEVATDVDVACRAVRNTSAEVAAADAARLPAQRRPAAIERMTKVGKARPIQIIAAQEAASEAEVSRFRALVRHETAWADLRQATAEGLERYKHLLAAATRSPK